MVKVRSEDRDMCKGADQEKAKKRLALTAPDSSVELITEG